MKHLKWAVTGGIGSGKSYVCKILKAHGIDVFDCDASAKRLMRTSESLKQQLVALIGDNVYIEGRLNKAAVADFMMRSPHNIQLVNGLVHPAVARDFLSSGMAWMECAILFESGFDRFVDRVVCVTAPLETRIRRIIDRDHITREKAIEWIDKQLPQALVVERSHYEIVNDGYADVSAQVEDLLHSEACSADKND